MLARANNYEKMCKFFTKININENVIILHKITFFGKENTYFK